VKKWTDAEEWSRMAILRIEKGSKDLIGRYPLPTNPHGRYPAHEPRRFTKRVKARRQLEREELTKARSTEKRRLTAERIKQRTEDRNVRDKAKWGRKRDRYGRRLDQVCVTDTSDLPVTDFLSAANLEALSRETRLPAARSWGGKADKGPVRASCTPAPTSRARRITGKSKDTNWSLGRAETIGELQKLIQVQRSAVQRKKRRVEPQVDTGLHPRVGNEGDIERQNARGTEAEGEAPWCNKSVAGATRFTQGNIPEKRKHGSALGDCRHNPPQRRCLPNRGEAPQRVTLQQGTTLCSQPFVVGPS
jgi:hypothetical protein